MASVRELKDGDHSIKVSTAEMGLLRAGLEQLQGTIATDMAKAPESIREIATSLISGLNSTLGVGAPRVSPELASR
jgi:hypothetical protein